ncbi:LuxR C-terminal-related transcriptional regulator [Pseudomonas putida]|uniref:LuxR C-terminal-related transcriptional regulator n=1 Tax=Pseudomonas putida TaxID=303 RepID=UPI002270FB8A|nr:LuxR C-terminal-related transcriptional regulator [Pseudomonas putida]WAB99254.1 LuxR C-terminal-related transcriptional regulator [Pseudomonas putida]
MRSDNPMPHRVNLEKLDATLLSSKLHPPRLTQLIARPQLLQRLVESSNVPLIVLQSAPGYGRTCVLAQYRDSLQRQGRRVAWLTIDHSDRELDVFTMYLKTMIEQAAQGRTVPHKDARLHGGGLTECLNALLGLLDNYLDQPIFLILDDVHHLSGSDSVRLLSMLVEKAPVNLQISLSFRGEPCLSVARLRMHGKVVDIGVRDLSLSDGETSAILEMHGIRTIDPLQIESLRKRLEGWAGGLVLSAVQLRRDPELLQHLDHISGDRRQFAEFFLQDVFNRQPATIKRFLLHTSVVDQFCPPLCDLLTGSHHSHELIRECESLGLFMTPIDDQNYWYRYHPLFAEFLRKELRDQDASLQLALHERASNWFTEQGNHLEAFSQAFAAQQVQRAAEIMDTHCQDIFATQERAWQMVDRLPREVVGQFPSILLAQVWQLEMLWQFETCSELMETSRRCIQQLKQDKSLPEQKLRSLSHLLEHRELMLALLRDDLTTVQVRAQALLDDYEDAHPVVRASLYTALVTAQREHYKLGDVERLNTLATEHLKRLPNELGQVFHSAAVAPSRLMVGRINAAIQALNTALKTAEHLAGERSPLAAMVAVLLAKIHYERDDLPQAQDLITRYLPAATFIGFVDQAIAGWLTKARLAMIGGDQATAFATLDDADIFATEHKFERLRLFTLAERLKWLLRSGDIDEVIRLGRRNGLKCSVSEVSPSTHASTRDEARAMAWIRVAQAEDRLPEALSLAKLWHRYLEHVDVLRNMIRWGLIITHLSVLSGDHRAAQRMLRRTMLQAAPRQFIRVFLDEGPWLAGLLHEQLKNAVIANEPADTFATHLLRCMRPSENSASKSSLDTSQPFPILGALNSREIDILEMVDKGLLNREIGVKLGMTEGSVKWYLQQIYDKIGVRRRTQAADRARQLGILR